MSNSKPVSEFRDCNLGNSLVEACQANLACVTILSAEHTDSRGDFHSS